mmetsp:Transcript_23119/g.36173  ORF Transcript_23119/g.36173 Transcript_23119/m.36173 type:complete len:181 (-) Transcript_23119:44-586(-)
MVAVYGTSSSRNGLPSHLAGKRGVMVQLAGVMAVMAIGMLLFLAAQTGEPRPATKLAQLNIPARTMVLCEGHFLDTATGIPEEDYSVLSNPYQLEGYKEPLPADMRQAIDEKYAPDPAHYRFVGCLDDDKVNEVRKARGEGVKEHYKLAFDALGDSNNWRQVAGGWTDGSAYYKAARGLS